MVRTPPARAHPSLHHRPAAPRDRAGRAARLHALPVRLAARVAGDARQRAGGAGRRARATGRLRGAGGGVGKRTAARARQRLFDLLAGRPVHRRPHRLDAPARRTVRIRAGRPHRAGARDADRAAAAPPAARVDARSPRSAATTSRRCPRAPSASPTTCSEHGASFFDELVAGAHLLRTELEDALAELVARGRVHCDSFAGLRALLVPQSKRPSAFGAPRPARARCSASRTRAAGR